MVSYLWLVLLACQGGSGRVSVRYGTRSALPEEPSLYFPRTSSALGRLSGGGFTHLGLRYPRTLRAPYFARDGQGGILRGALALSLTAVPPAPVLTLPAPLATAPYTPPLPPGSLSSLSLRRPPSHGTLRLRAGTRPSSFLDPVSYTHRDPSACSDYFTLKISTRSDAAPRHTRYLQVNVVVEGCAGGGNKSPKVEGSRLLQISSPMAPLTGQILDAGDDTTERELIHYRLVKSPSYGHFMTTDSPGAGEVSTSFTGGDLARFKVAFLPHRFLQPLGRETAEFEVCDGEGACSSAELGIVFGVSPQLISTPPQGVSVLEHGRAPLLPLPSNYQDFNVTVLSGPVRGYIEMNGEPVTHFSQMDLHAGTITYQHTAGAYTDSDNVILEISAEGHSSRVLFPITIFPKDILKKFPEVKKIGQTNFNRSLGEKDFVYDISLDHPHQDYSAEETLVKPSQLGQKWLKRQKVEKYPSHKTAGKEFINRTLHFPGESNSKYKPHKSSPLDLLSSEEISDSDELKKLGNSDNWRVKSNKKEKHQKRNQKSHKSFDGENYGGNKHSHRSENQKKMSGEETSSMRSRRSPAPLDEPFKLVMLPGRATIFVDEGESAEITNDDLRVPETKNVRFFVENQPEHGEIILSYEPSERFTMEDLNANDVFYVHKGDEIGNSKLYDHFTLSATSDKRGYVVEVDVIIEPIDDAAPVLEIKSNPPLKVLEGGRISVTTAHITVKDSDTESEDITCKIIAQPMFGHLEITNSDKRSAITRFTYEDVLNGNLEYVQSIHVGFEPTEDGFSLVCNDPPNNTDIETTNHGIVPLIVIPADDEAPFISPKPMKVAAQSVTPLGQDLLNVEDLDTPLDKLSFRIEEPPKIGKILKEARASDYERVQEFSYRDLGSIHYLSNYRESTEDSFELSVTDGIQRTEGKIKVYIQYNDDFTPQLLLNEGLEVESGTTGVITSQHLLADDLNSSPSELYFVVKDTPLFGTLFLNVSREVEVQPGSNFTQADLEAGALYYRHTDSSSSMDVFVFDVTDGANALTNQNFFITIRSNSSSYPVVYSKTPILEVGGVLSINSEVLNATDTDTEDSNIEFHVMSDPKQGKLERSDYPGEPVQVFSQKNLLENKIKYIHNGNLSSSPEIIQFEVTDGHKSVFHSFTINFTTPQVQDAYSADSSEEVSPSAAAEILWDLTTESYSKIILHTNEPITYISHLEGDKLGIPITKKSLYAEGSPGSEVTYIVTGVPASGALYKSGSKVNSFSQDDINSESIFYHLNEGSNSTSDSFQFDVVGKGAPLKRGKFHLNWSFVSFVQTNHTISESSHEYSILLQRRGSLKDAAFVAVALSGGNASFGIDYNIVAEQVQFNPGQKEAHFILKIVNDEEFEGPEAIRISLGESYYTAAEEPKEISVIIVDEEDEPTMSFEKKFLEVKENSGEIIIPIVRTGDITTTAKVRCITENGSAKGGDALDFSHVLEEIDFLDEQLKSVCRVSINDDGFIEDDEFFWVRLTDPSGGKIGDISQVKITIKSDGKDLPQVSLENESLTVGEDIMKFGITVKLNKVSKNATAVVDVLSRSVTATAEEDYVMVHRKIIFPPETASQQIYIYIIDDIIEPKVEGAETFVIYLANPINCKITEPKEMTIIIDDTRIDAPTIQFTKKDFHTQEISEVVHAELVRSGDRSGTSSVICYSQFGSATPEDFFERPKSDNSIVTFYPGEARKSCTVTLKDDTIFERKESFNLHIIPVNDSATIGSNSMAEVSILDLEDYGTIRFGKQHFFVNEPKTAGAVTHVNVPIVRDGDISDEAEVHVFARDGSAKGGEDYMGKSKRLRFPPNNRTLFYEVQILYDNIIEPREAFSLHLENSNDVTPKAQKSTVFIYDAPHIKDLTFPSPPIITSLWDYEIVDSNTSHARQGYPLICKTVCDSFHKHHKKFSRWCKRNNVTTENTLYHWQLEDLRGHWRDIPLDIFFANTSSVTLDSVYFRSGYRVRCGSRPYGMDTIEGRESFSPPVLISKTEGICPSPVQNMMGAEPFVAHLNFADPDGEHDSLVKLSITFPHYDGMYPAFSTQNLNDISQSLAHYGPRAMIHKCSNLVSKEETHTKFGFNDNLDRIPLFYERSLYSTIRGETAVSIYRNLDIESCLWSFEAYYDINELVSVCGASITTETETSGKSAFILQLPLYVSYVTPSLLGWQHADSFTSLKLLFVYDTSLISQEGLVPHQTSQIEGILHPTSMHISNNGSLVVNFKTQPKFPGLFLLHHPISSLKSTVIAKDNPDLQLTLDLVSNRTRNGTLEQLWEFTSNFANTDYTGRFEINLIPCVFIFMSNDACSPEPPIKFPLDIYFQQPTEPIPQQYTLNTTFHLIRKRQLAETDSNDDYSVFEIGDQIYGFISVASLGKFRGQMDLKIDKCYICTGITGYAPKYNPTQKEFGCLAKTNKLMYALKIIDRQDPKSVVSSFFNKPFGATLSEGLNSSMTSIVEQYPGTDVFSFDLTPLFGHNVGRIWYVQCTYTVQSSNTNHVKKRSVGTSFYGKEHDLSSIFKGKGTNMHMIRLSDTIQDAQKEEINTNRISLLEDDKESKNEEEDSEIKMHIWWFSIALCVCSFSTFCVAITFLCALKKKPNSNLDEFNKYRTINYSVCKNLEPPYKDGSKLSKLRKSP